ncbi:MAG: ribbon-helix-helix domain-containing protein [Candidatus Acetothermia bacterium]|jgi:predicted transcriptional regulator|nr:ribbon-helix-helix domain-containing protein [Candidatus Acetothermia bacterium]MDH7505907.1 ribbon-helix-helix protein, CopG family [Candidatus Acetothermia bacterium]
MRDKLGIYVPREKLKERPLERLAELARKQDRSVNYLVVQAILEYLKREEKKA